MSLTRNSSAELQEILCLGDPEVASSLGVARVIAAAPDSSHAGLVVRQVGHSTTVQVSSVAGAVIVRSSAADMNVTVAGYSTTVNVSSLGGAVIVRSSAADFAATVSGNVGQASTVWAVQVDGRVRAQNSTIGDLLASVQQNSTTWAVQVDGRVRAQNSTIGDLLASVQQNSTVWAVQVDGRVRAQNSTIGDLLASVQQNSTTWVTQPRLHTSSGGAVEGSTNGVAQGALGLHVRIAPSSVQTVAVSTAGASATNTILVSSQANPIKVWSYCITSTVITPSTVSFRSSLAGLKWPMVLGSGSSGITGANLASQPPHPLFMTDANTALTFHVPTAGAEYSIALSYST